MKTTGGYSNWLRIVLFGSIFLIGGILVFFWQNSNMNQQIQLPGQFVMVGDNAYLIREGSVYEYEAEDHTWKRLELPGEAKQMARGDNLSVLMTDGSVYSDGDFSLTRILEERMPSLSAYSFFMAEKALTLSKEVPFACINGSIEINFRALLQDGDILYQGYDGYERYRMEEETPVFLSGSYILTDQGNVYELKIKLDNGIRDINLECRYDGGDMASISALGITGRCLGLRKNGTVVSWDSRHGRLLDVGDWKNVVAVQQDVDYGVGLTAKGTILYEDYGLNRSEEIVKELETWTDIVQITVGYDLIVGLKEDGSCCYLDVKAFIT